VKTQHDGPHEIELLIDDAGSADVHIGHASRGRWPWLVTALVVVALLAFTATRSGTQPRPATTTFTSIVGTTTTSTAAAISPTTGLPRSFPRGASNKVGPVMPFGRETGAFLYLTPSGGAPTAFQIYNVDTGDVQEISFGSDIGWYLRAIDMSGAVVLDGGAVLAVKSDDIRTLTKFASASVSLDIFGRVASGPDGGVWVRDPTRGTLQLFGPSGPIGDEYDLPIGADLYGSMSDGRPVLRGADLRSYVMDRLGTRRLLSSGLTSYVENGRYTETTCDDQQHCETVGHFDTQKRAMTLPVASMVRFQAGGPLIAIVREDESLSLLNGVTGEEVPVAMTEHVPYDSTFPLATNVTFLPDGHGLVASTSSGLVLIDTAGNVMARLASLRGVMGTVIGAGHGFTPS
jgi:hypothetical protein